MNTEQQKSNIIAAAWGFAEATFFFIVPDVYITYRALKGYRAALIASLYTLAGALVGGTLMYLWGAHSATALEFVRHVPAINSPMVVSAHADFQNNGAFAVLQAPVRGIPYKLYSVLAPLYNVNFLLFLAVSVVARMARFVVVSVIVATLARLLGRWLGYRQLLGVLIGFWVVFYAIYFHHYL